MESIKEIDLIIILLAGTLVMLVMSAIVVYFVVSYQSKVLKQREAIRVVEMRFQNEILAATFIAAEKERTLIAKNIHDDIGVLINVIKMNNNQLNQPSLDIETTKKIIETNNQLATEIYENIRLIYNDLMSPTLIKLGLVRALGQFCDQLNQSNVIKIKFKSDGLNVRLSINREIQLFRVCKEVIHNVIKHSGATDISINFELNSDTVIITVGYNGIGINDVDVKNILKNNTGIGLKSLYGRMQAMNGSINYYTEQGQHSIISIRSPVK